MDNRRNQSFVVILIVMILCSGFGVVPETLQYCVRAERQESDLQDHNSMNHQVDGQLGSAMTEVSGRFYFNMSRFSDTHLAKGEVKLRSCLFGGIYSIFALLSMSLLMILEPSFSGFYAQWRRTILYIQRSDGEKDFSIVFNG